MTETDRSGCFEAIARMENSVQQFYSRAVGIGVHPFIEFAGVMSEYIKCCHDAVRDGIDFRNCNKHTGQHLPMRPHQIEYLNEKLECIFTGRSVVTESEKP